MRRPDIIFHVGLPKTGSTSIQRFFRQHYATCVERGLLYPKTGSSNRGLAHHSWQKAFSPSERPYIEDWIIPADTDELLVELEAETAQAQPRKLLFSSEAFTPETVSVLLDNITHEKATVVLFLRRADQLLEAQYAQGIKTGRHKMQPVAFFEFIEQNQPEWLKPYTLLSHYASLPVDLIVQPFEKEQIDGPLLHHFLDMISEPGLCDLELERERNTRLHPLVIQLLQARAGDERLLGTKYNTLREHLNEIAVARQAIISNSFFSPRQRLAVLESVADDYRKIATELLGRPQQSLFLEPKPDADDPWEPPPAPTLADAVDMMLALWTSPYENKGGQG